MNPTYEQLDAWIDAHFDEQVRFLQALIQVPTDTPPGNNTPHAQRAAELIGAMGIAVDQYEVPQDEVQAAGLETITNLVARRRYGDGGRVVATESPDGWCRFEVRLPTAS